MKDVENQLEMWNKTRNDELRAETLAFHHKHPKVYELFCKFTKQLIRRGFNNYGVNAVCERIRWETDEAQVDGSSTFKFNNNYRPFYSRMFMDQYPEYEGFFRTREQTTHNKPATNKPELTPENLNYTQ